MIEKGMERTEEGQKKLERTRARMTEAVAKELEKQDQDRTGQGKAASSGIPLHERPGLEHLRPEPQAPAEQVGPAEPRAQPESRQQAEPRAPAEQPQTPADGPEPRDPGGEGGAGAMDLGGIEQITDIVEMYSPERVTMEADKFNLKPGKALDLTTGWDFNKREHREAAREYIQKVRPK